MKRFFEVISKFAELPKEERPILPKRQTRNSAGYDFYANEDIKIAPSCKALVRTRIKASMPKNEMLLLFMRSSMGIKHGLRLANCVAVIDSDYYNNKDNEGEILAVIINDSFKEFTIKKGERFMQGVFTKYEITDNDDAYGERVGGVGSTK